MASSTFWWVAEYSTALCFERFLGGEFNPTGSGGVRVKGCNPPSDTLVSTRVGSCCDLHASVVVVDDGEVEFAVDRFAVFGVGVGQDGDDAFELGDELLDLYFGESSV